MLDDDAAVSHPADTVLVSWVTHRSLKRGDLSHSGFVSSSAARVTGPGGATVGQAPALHLIQGQDHACGSGPATPSAGGQGCVLTLRTSCPRPVCSARHRPPTLSLSP